MAGYKIFFRKSVWKDFESIPKKELNRILEKIESLFENPRPSSSQKLSAQELSHSSRALSDHLFASRRRINSMGR
jgi:mRNA-degrading endonuclease RelE of RelBE toxin-antitoxin system